MKIKAVWLIAIILLALCSCAPIPHMAVETGSFEIHLAKPFPGQELLIANGSDTKNPCQNEIYRIALDHDTIFAIPKQMAFHLFVFWGDNLTSYQFCLRDLQTEETRIVYSIVHMGLPNHYNLYCDFSKIDDSTALYPNQFCLWNRFVSENPSMSP